MDENKNLGTDISTERKSGEMSTVHAILIEMSNVNLNGRMVLGSNQPVCGRAAYQKASFSKHPKTEHIKKKGTMKNMTAKERLYYIPFPGNVKLSDYPLFVLHLG